MIPEVVQEGQCVLVRMSGLPVALVLSPQEASGLAERLDDVADRMTDSGEWKDGVSMDDVRKAESTGAGLIYAEDWRRIEAPIRGLRPCPFCGKRKPRIRMRCDRSLESPRIFKCIMCWYCCAQTHESAHDVLYHVRNWNRRAVE